MGDNGVVVEDSADTSRYPGDDKFLEASVGDDEFLEARVGVRSRGEIDLFGMVGDVSDDVFGGSNSGGLEAFGVVTEAKLATGAKRPEGSADEVADEDGRTRGCSMVEREDTSADEVADNSSVVTDEEGTRGVSMVEEKDPESILRSIVVSRTSALTGGVSTATKGLAGISGGFGGG